MELQQNLDLVFDVNAVLCGQDADAAVLRARRPTLVKIVERARRESLSLFAPKVIFREYAVTRVQHEQLILAGDRRIKSKLLGEVGSIVSLMPSFIMLPRKSLTMLIGLCASLDSSGRTCDFCIMRATCRYQKLYLQ